MALASGKSLIRTGPLTLHTQTAIHFAELISGVSLVSFEYRVDLN
jgi:RNA 3'-terminal phosphate cyclase (ATP)